MKTAGRNRMIYSAAAACLLAAFAVSLCVGRYPLSPGDIAAALAGGEGMSAQVFWRLRLPRSVACLVSGAAMGLSGAVYQAVFGNALAAPDIMGVSGGATLGAAVSVVFLGGALGQTAAFLGGLLALGASLVLTRASGSRGAAGIVLSGILVSALVKTGIMLLKTLADTEGELAAIEFFTMGSFAGITAASLPPLLAGVLLGGAGLFLLRRQVALLTLSDEEAAALGVRVGPVRAAVLALATLAACAVSAQAGVIAFSALIAPHGARLLLGGRSRGRLALSMLLGGTLMLVSDVVARLSPGAELPVSVFTTLMGVPVIALLMIRGGGRDG
ncbi:MAG: iron ABC transporter permease [Clostridia bacterium]|nr:iron ABC transporter permease [Clostridia bacterium]